MHINEIRKAIVATVTALGTWGVTAAADGTYDQVELWGLCAVIVAGLSTYGVRNHDAEVDTGMNMGQHHE